MKNFPSLIFAPGLILLLIISYPVQATAPRITAQMFGEEKKYDIAAYEMAPLATAASADQGLAVALVTSAFKAAGQTVTVDVMPAKPLAQYALRNNDAVALIGGQRDLSVIGKSKVIAEVFYVRLGQYFYYRPYHAELPWQGKLADLKGLNYGALGEEDMAPYKKAGIGVVEAEERELFEKLHERKIDFIGVSDLEGRAWITRAYPNEQAAFGHLNAVAWEQPLFLIFAKNNPRTAALHRAFVAGLSKVIQNGQYQASLERYYGKGQVPDDYAKRLARYRQAGK